MFFKSSCSAVKQSGRDGCTLVLVTTNFRIPSCYETSVMDKVALMQDVNLKNFANLKIHGKIRYNLWGRRQPQGANQKYGFLCIQVKLTSS